MRILLLLSSLLINWTCTAQVSNNISMHCGSYNEKALEYFDSGNYGLQINQLNEAKGLFMASIKLDSTFCDAWDNLSVCYRRMGLFEEAFVAGFRSIRIDSTNSDGWTNCGYSAWLGGKTELALTMFNNIQRLLPNNPEGYYGKSLVLYSIDSISDARANIYSAERIYSANNLQIGNEVYLLKGFIEFKSGNKKIAQEIFLDIYSSFENNAELNYFLGQCILENEFNVKKANKYLKRAKSLGYVADNELIKNE
jgi:tetratricopeptide (TPR) repeat protein